MIAAPIHWNHTPVRACAVCRHGRRIDGRPCKPDGLDAELCTCPDVAGQRRQVDVFAARANHGPCGPEAHHLAFHGLLS